MEGTPPTAQVGSETHTNLTLSALYTHTYAHTHKPTRILRPREGLHLWHQSVKFSFSACECLLLSVHELNMSPVFG